MYFVLSENVELLKWGDYKNPFELGMETYIPIGQFNSREEAWKFIIKFERKNHLMKKFEKKIIHWNKKMRFK